MTNKERAIAKFQELVELAEARRNEDDDWDPRDYLMDDEIADYDESIALYTMDMDDDTPEGPNKQQEDI